MPITFLNRVRGGGASSFYDFTLGALPSGVSFTRASAGWRFNTAGVLVQETTDVPRFQYDASSLAPLGLLIEQARTNVIRNSSGAGAVAGTPGTPPTNWAMSGTVNGVTQEIVGTGTEDGIPYIDVRCSGTPSASSSFSLIPDSYTLFAAVAGQTWSSAWFLKLVAGAWANVGSGGISHYVTERDVGGTSLVSTSALRTPTGAALRTQRSLLQRTLSNGSTARVTTSLGFNYTNGQAIDFTIRIGSPQLVNGDVVGSPILSTGTAVTRAADVPLITNPAALSDQCWIIKARTAGSLPVGGNVQMLFCVDDGSANNRRCAWRNSSGVVQVRASVAGVSTCFIDLGFVANDTELALAARFADYNFAASLNGGAIVRSVGGINPLGMTTARIGHDTVGRYWNESIKTIEHRRTATDAELPLLAA